MNGRAGLSGLGAVVADQWPVMRCDAVTMVFLPTSDPVPLPRGVVICPIQTHGMLVSRYMRLSSLPKR